MGPLMSGPAVEPAGTGGERERLVSATIAIASVRGFADTTVEMLLERAGLDRRSFEGEFERLEDCFLAAWDEIHDEYMTRARAAYEAEHGWRHRIRALADETVRCIEARPDESRLLAVEVLELGEDGRARLEAMIGELAEMVDAGRLEAANAAQIPPSTAEGIVGGSYHRLLRAMRTEREPNPEPLVSELVSFAVIPYLGIDVAQEELARGAG
jgi:AcrR family transcriptional regulator